LKPRWLLVLPAALLTVSLGGWLLWDALSFSLSPYDPATGRERGCYTVLETWARVKRPSFLRKLELFVGAGSLGLTFFWFQRRPAP